MKRALLLIAILGCKSGDKPAPAPTETGSAGSATGSGSGSAMAGSGSAMAGSGSNTPACLLTVTLTQTNIAWTGGDVSAGHTDYKPGEPPHLDLLKVVTPTCAVRLVADNRLKYQDVISVMDAILKLGLVNISLGQLGDTPRANTRPQPNIDMKWVKGADGKPALQGTPDPLSGNVVSKATPVLVITKTQVLFKGEVLGKPDDEKLGDEITAKLPASPKDSTLIIQADADTSALTINAVVWAVGKQGYTNALFAVKNK